MPGSCGVWGSCPVPPLRDARGARRVLVLDGEQRSALAVVRSLGRAGYRVTTGASDPGAIAAASKYSEATVLLPSPLQAPEAFRDAVAEEVRSAGADVVLPVTESAALALLGDEELGPLLPMPSREAFTEANDKVALMQRAAGLGIDIPRFVTLRDADDEASELWDSFPAVVKPGRSVVGSGAQRTRTTVKFVDDRASLRAALASLHPDAFPVMVQERLVGPGVGVFLLVHEGEKVASFAHRRLREKPPEGGVSVYRESVRAPEPLVERAVRLLQSFHWMGVAMVEFKHDEASGRYGLMEINGRFWGSLQLAIDAGVDFPRLLVDRFLGIDRGFGTDYRTGIRTRWEWGDVDHLLIRMRRGGARGGLWSWFRPWWPGDRFEVFRLSDPGPFWAESRAWIRDLRGGG